MRTATVTLVIGITGMTTFWMDWNRPIHHHAANYNNRLWDLESQWNGGTLLMFHFLSLQFLCA